MILNIISIGVDLLEPHGRREAVEREACRKGLKHYNVCYGAHA
jgi:hypothetical protein